MFRASTVSSSSMTSSWRRVWTAFRITPLTHVNPYVLLDLLRRQSQWLHLLEARVRSLEESL